MKMKVIIDRFEGTFAVAERPDRTMVNIPRSRLPPEAKEGDVLVLEGDNIRIDAAETAQRRKAAEDRVKDLWK
jgi:hypothetical protein